MRLINNCPIVELISHKLTYIASMPLSPYILENLSPGAANCVYTDGEVGVQ